MDDHPMIDGDHVNEDERPFLYESVAERSADDITSLLQESECSLSCPRVSKHVMDLFYLFKVIDKAVSSQLPGDPPRVTAAALKAFIDHICDLAEKYWNSLSTPEEFYRAATLLTDENTCYYWFVHQLLLQVCRPTLQMLFVCLTSSSL